ncbi:MAG: DUF4339 domain-containing protein [Hyphomicrobiales bacterium]
MKGMTAVGVTALAVGVAACVALAPVSAQAQAGPPPLPQSGPPPLPPQPAAAQYYYNDNGKQAGPFSLDQIKQKIASGAITPDTLIWKSGTPNWVAMKDIPEFGRQAASAGSVGGCGGSTTIFADDFSQTQPDKTESFDGGKLKFKALAGDFDYFTYKRMLSGDSDICVMAQIPRSFAEAAKTYAGVIFGASDNSNFQAFMIAPSGLACVVRVQGKKIDYPIEWTDANGLKTDKGAKNMLRITVKGGSATLYINDVKFGVYKGPLPNGTGKLGFFVKSEPGRRDTWKFANLKVTSLD